MAGEVRHRAADATGAAARRRFTMDAPSGRRAPAAPPPPTERYCGRREIAKIRMCVTVRGT